MNYFIYISHDFTAREEMSTGIAEVMGSNPVEALIFFRLLLSNCLNWKIYCDDHTSLLSELCTNEINSSSRDIFESEFRFKKLNNSRLSPVLDRIIVYESVWL